MLPPSEHSSWYLGLRHVDMAISITVKNMSDIREVKLGISRSVCGSSTGALCYNEQIGLLRLWLWNNHCVNLAQLRSARPVSFRPNILRMSYVDRA